MRYVRSELRISEATLLKAENRVLRIVAVALGAFLIYGEWRVRQVINSVTPQAIYDACNKEPHNVGRK